MKNDHLTNSKTFCMFPWMHMNVTPKGNIYPCCSSDYVEPFANTKDSTLAQAFNNENETVATGHASRTQKRSLHILL